LDRIEVRAPSGAYPVLVGAGATRELPALLERFSRVAVVRDALVAAPGLPAPELVLEGGEAVKTWESLRRVLAFLEDSGLRRDGCVVAVGGGTIGDLTGLAAALWQRGVAHVQVPTTLLGMVDAAIGGKTAIDTELAKNAVGAFWQPAAVVADLDHLRTLAEAQLRSGLAEVLKYAVAMDAELAGILESSRDDIQARSAAALEPVVVRCAHLKAAVVAADERELSGRRAVLNYGHTAGHALEAVSGYSVLHGQAVAFGMRVAARLAVSVGACDGGLVGEQDRLLEMFGLPGRLPAAEPDPLLEALGRDKKSAAGRVRWVLPRELGRAEPGWEVPEAEVRAALAEVLAT
jgi:3-dehydroquinate synthase